jgi:hypothetical protein
MAWLVYSLNLSSSFKVEKRSMVWRRASCQQDTQVFYILYLHIARKVVTDEREHTQLECALSPPSASSPAPKHLP